MAVVCGGREFELSAITVSESTLVTITNIRGNKEGERVSMFSFNFRGSNPGFYCVGLVAGSFCKSRRGAKPLLENKNKNKGTKEQTKSLHGYKVTESKRKGPGPSNLIESKVLMA